MSTNAIGPLRRAWYKWKALRLPWRKKFLVGLDLSGNTYWEFKDRLSPSRMRRIVEFPSSTYYSEVKMSPQWHQWLRHTRQDPPTLTEQSQDVVRQERLKALVAAADARWEAKPKYIETPQETAALAETQEAESVQAEALKPQREAPPRAQRVRPQNTEFAPSPDPWKQAASGPSENWQPDSWSPTAAKR